jgi:hypothetical protein
MKSRTGFVLKTFLREAIQFRCESLRRDYDIGDNDAQWLLCAVLRSSAAFDLENLQVAVANMQVDRD